MKFNAQFIIHLRESDRRVLDSERSDECIDFTIVSVLRENGNF